MENKNNMPEKKFSTGAITATIWQNQGKSKTGDEVSFRTVSFQRRYKDKNDEWQSTNTLHVNDLPKAALVLQKAYDYIVSKSVSNNGAAAEGVNEEEIAA